MCGYGNLSGLKNIQMRVKENKSQQPRTQDKKRLKDYKNNYITFEKKKKKKKGSKTSEQLNKSVKFNNY